MDVVVALVEAISFDILFIGMLSLIVFQVSVHLGQATPSTCFGAAMAGWHALLRKTRDPGRLAVLLLVGGLVGMLANMAADTVLDTEQLNGFMVIKPLQVFELRDPDQERDPEKEWWGVIVEGFEEEDRLKFKALRDVMANDSGLDEALPEFASGRPCGWKCESGYPSSYEDLAKAAYQRARTAYLQVGSGALAGNIAREYVQLRIVRALWIGVMVLLVVTVAGAWGMALLRFVDGRSSSLASALARATPASLVKGGRRSLFRSAGTTTLKSMGWLLFLVVGACLSLETWSIQSDRYYKKVFYAYASILELREE